VTDSDKDLIQYRLERAYETLEDPKFFINQEDGKPVLIDFIMPASMLFLGSSFKKACSLPDIQELGVCSIFIL
jgi:hypothetical protein